MCSTFLLVSKVKSIETYVVHRQVHKNIQKRSPKDLINITLCLLCFSFWTVCYLRLNALAVDAEISLKTLSRFYLFN